MLKIKNLSLVGLLVLAGCSGLSYAMDNYTGVKPETFAYAGENWRVFHKPLESRLMITPSLKSAFIGGAKTGATFGLAGNQTDPENRFRTAAMMFIKQNVSDTCGITSGKLVVNPQYEYNYDC